MQQTKSIKKILPFTWWKLIIGLLVIGFSIPFGIIYLQNIHNMFVGVLAVFLFALGLFFIYWSIKTVEGGFFYASKRQKYTGNENAIILFAKRNGNNNKDIPLIIKFVELMNPPHGARLHYVRNLKKHFYELFNNNITHKLEPVILPDKKSFPPELYKIPATMQLYKDYINYSPATIFQKIAPGMLLLAIGIIGVLMVVTTGGN